MHPAKTTTQMPNKATTAKTLLKTLALCTAISSIGLSACHNDHDDNASNNNSGNNNGMATLSGTAATGAALKNASVTASCNNNTGFSQPVSTDANGQWSGQVIAANLPCALQAKTADLALHSYAVAAGNVNITPLTDLSIAKISRKQPTDWFKQYQILLESQLKTAIDELSQQLTSKNYVLPTQFNLLTTSFKIGDAFDQLLDAFAAAINASSLKTYNALLNQVVASGSISSIPMAIPVTPPNTTQSCASKKLPVTSLSSISDYSGEYKDKGLTVFKLDTATGKIIAGSSTAMIKEVCGPNTQSNGTNHVLVTDKGYITLFKDNAGKYSAESTDFGGFYGTKATSSNTLCESQGADDKLGFKNAPQDFCGFSKASSIAIQSPDIYTFFNADKSQNVKITVENNSVKTVQLEDNNYAWACGVGTLAACTGVTFDQRNANFIQFPFNSTVLTPINGTQQPLTINGLLIHFSNSPSTPPSTNNPNTPVIVPGFNAAACKPVGNTYENCKGNVIADFEDNHLKYYSAANLAGGGKLACIIKKSGDRLSISVEGKAMIETLFNGDQHDDLYFNKTISTTTLRAENPMVISAGSVVSGSTIALVFDASNKIDDATAYPSDNNIFVCR